MMTRSAFILGGTGQIGRVAARRLMRDGWRVTIASRHALPNDLAMIGVTGVRVDRSEAGSLAAAIGDGADLLLDCIAYDEGHADQLIEVQQSVGCTIAISSASVYRDAAGRTLDEARVSGFPSMPEPITEDQPTIAPGPDTYSTRKAAMEARLLDRATGPTVIVRPCAIHGEHSSAPREWFFVKRLLDGRHTVPLAYEGRSRFHTAAAGNIAALVAACAARGETMILNAVDPDAPTVTEIARTVATLLGERIEIVPLADRGYPPKDGVSPWTIPRPFVLSDAAARSTGFVPVGDYATLVAPMIRWLATIDPADWRVMFPGLAAYPWDLFDYLREDAAMAAA